MRETETETEGCVKVEVAVLGWKGSRVSECERETETEGCVKVEVAVLGWKGSQTLRILCYRKGPDKHGDILLGR